MHWWCCDPCRALDQLPDPELLGSPPRLHEHANTSCDAARYTTCYICSVLERTASECLFGVYLLQSKTQVVLAVTPEL